MEAQRKDYYTVKEAAAEWGISPQAVYQRLNKMDKARFTALVAGKRVITRAGMESFNQPDGQPGQTEVDNSINYQSELERLKMELRDAQAKAEVLQATVTAQQAHIDSLKAALDREQSLHMASLQQRLPAGRGGGFFSWLRGKKAE